MNTTEVRDAAERILTAETNVEVYRWATNNRTEVLIYARRFGGSFMYSLGELFMVADRVNTVKLLAAFPDEFKQLYGFKIRDDEQKAVIKDDGN